MSDDLREKFMSRISTVGWGARESVQTVLGLVVSDLRAQISENAFVDADLERAIRFHDTAEVLWRDTLASDPPLAVSDLRTRLDKLVGECSGPLMGSMPHLQRAREHAHSLDVMRRVREEEI